MDNSKISNLKTHKYRPSLMHISHLDRSSLHSKTFDKQDNKYVMQMKVIIIGDSGVGKTSIIKRLQYDSFSELHQNTLSIDCTVATFQTDESGNKADVLIWDTCGSEKFRSVAKSYYTDVNGVLLVYDIKNQSSFEHLEFWLNDLDTTLGKERRKKSIPIIVCANKSEELDKRKVDYAMADSWCCLNSFKHIDCSAKSGINIRYAFEELVLAIIQKVDDKSQVLEVSMNDKTGNVMNVSSGDERGHSRVTVSNSCFKEKSCIKDIVKKHKKEKDGCC